MTILKILVARSMQNKSSYWNEPRYAIHQFGFILNALNYLSMERDVIYKTDLDEEGKVVEESVI